MSSTHDWAACVDIISSPMIPRGVFYLMAKQGVSGFETHPLRWQEDPWGEATYDLKPQARIERAKGLDFLADLLDGMCTDLGMDPDATWRQPHIREREARERRRQMHWQMDARISMAVNNPRASAVIGSVL